jgi:hypothetical protein
MLPKKFLTLALRNLYRESQREASNDWNAVCTTCKFRAPCQSQEEEEKEEDEERRRENQR